MKKYLKILPLILYPYAYLIWLVIYFFAFGMLEEKYYETILDVLFVVFIVFNLYVGVITIYNAVITSRNRYTAYEVAKMNLAVKAWQIPAYIFHFIMGVLGLLMGIWGIAFLLIAITVDVITIALTGINAIGCAIKMKKDGVVNTAVAVLMAIGSFVFCLDVIVAIVYVILSKKKEKSILTKIPK